MLTLTALVLADDDPDGQAARLHRVRAVAVQAEAVG